MERRQQKCPAATPAWPARRLSRRGGSLSVSWLQGRNRMAQETAERAYGLIDQWKERLARLRGEHGGEKASCWPR